MICRVSSSAASRSSIVRVFQYSFASEGVSVVTTEITERSIRTSSTSAIALLLSESNRCGCSTKRRSSEVSRCAPAPSVRGTGNESISGSRRWAGGDPAPSALSLLPQRTIHQWASRMLLLPTLITNDDYMTPAMEGKAPTGVVRCNRRHGLEHVGGRKAYTLGIVKLIISLAFGAVLMTVPASDPYASLTPTETTL